MSDEPTIQTVKLNAKPMATVGAGRLTSMIWKDGDEQAGWRYRFNVFCTAPVSGRVSQLFTPADVIHLVKLAHVLAAVISDDGCISPEQRSLLRRLATELDQLWTKVPRSRDSLTRSGDPESGNQPSISTGAAHGNTTHP